MGQAHSSWKHLRLSSLYPDVPLSLYSSLFSLYDTNNANLTLFWTWKPSPQSPVEQGLFPLFPSTLEEIY